MTTLLDEISRKTSQNTYTTEIVDRFGLSHLAARTPVAHLSGGQKTRLALAKVIFYLLRIFCCWMNRPTTWISKCWNGWKAGCSKPAPLFW